MTVLLPMSAAHAVPHAPHGPQPPGVSARESGSTGTALGAWLTDRLGERLAELVERQGHPHEPGTDPDAGWSPGVSDPAPGATPPGHGPPPAAPGRNGEEHPEGRGRGHGEGRDRGRGGTAPEPGDENRRAAPGGRGVHQAQRPPEAYGPREDRQTGRPSTGTDQNAGNGRGSALPGSALPPEPPRKPGQDSARRSIPDRPGAWSPAPVAPGERDVADAQPETVTEPFFGDQGTDAAVGARSTGPLVPVLPLGAGLTSLGLGMAFLALRLRRG